MLQGEKYQASRTQEWTNAICSQTVAALQTLNDTFKYTATCVIFQKTGGGVHTGSAACWEPERDGCILERWDSPTMTCIITVFACSL
ncbi:unnamed protein product [Choristocarpus tenellus]